MPVIGLAGLRYQADFLSDQQEQELLALFQTLPFKEMQYKAYTARRRVISYGRHYDFDNNRLNAAPGLIEALHPLRHQVATWLGISPDAFQQVLLAEYRPGTPLGWHRDVPEFEDIVGVSLNTAATLCFRPYPVVMPSARNVLKLTLEPRSVYLLSGPSRWDWQHRVEAVSQLRYSITFRTLRARQRD